MPQASTPRAVTPARLCPNPCAQTRKHGHAQAGASSGSTPARARERAAAHLFVDLINSLGPGRVVAELVLSLKHLGHVVLGHGLRCCERLLRGTSGQESEHPGSKHASSTTLCLVPPPAAQTNSLPAPRPRTERLRRRGRGEDAEARRRRRSFTALFAAVTPVVAALALRAPARTGRRRQSSQPRRRQRRQQAPPRRGGRRAPRRPDSSPPQRVAKPAP